jgi:hypothetical protein
MPTLQASSVGHHLEHVAANSCLVLKTYVSPHCIAMDMACLHPYFLLTRKPHQVITFPLFLVLTFLLYEVEGPRITLKFYTCL